MDLYSSLTRICLQIYQTATLQRRCVSGRDQLPPGAKIIAANHPNASDAYHFAFILEGKFYALIAGTSFSQPVVGWLMTRCGQIPVHKNHELKALDQACELLKQGQTVLIFPEGRLNPDHLSLKVGTGAVRMSLISGAPIIPVGIYVPEQFLQTRIVQYDGRVEKRCYQVGGHCYFQIGEPWYPAREADPQGRACTPRALTIILMEKIDALTYQARQAALADRRAMLPSVWLPMDARPANHWKVQSTHGQRAGLPADAANLRTGAACKGGACSSQLGMAAVKVNEGGKAGNQGKIEPCVS